jgi:hypothetical protein
MESIMAMNSSAEGIEPFEKPALANHQVSLERLHPDWIIPGNGSMAAFHLPATPLRVIIVRIMAR